MENYHLIEFPKLGLNFDISRVAFKVFGFEIYWYALIISCGFALAVFLATKNSKKIGIKPDDIIDLALVGAILGFICARLYYVIFNWSAYKDNPLKIFNFREGGIALYGSLIGAVIAAILVARFKKIPPLKLIDFAIPYFVLAQAIGRWGNFVNQEAFGTNTTLPWGMTGDRIRNDAMQIGLNPTIPVHPTFLYESLWDIAVFVLLIWFRKRKKLDGEVFALYMISYGIGRAAVESLRIDSLMVGSTNIRVSLLLGIVFALCFGIFFIVRRRKAQQLALAGDETVLTGFEGVEERIQKEEDLSCQDTNSERAETTIQEKSNTSTEPDREK